MSTLKSQFNESQLNESRVNESGFNEIPRFSEQLPAPLNYFIIVNLIRFSEQKWSDGPHLLNQDLGTNKFIF